MNIAQLEFYFKNVHDIRHTMTLQANHGVGKSEIVRNNLRAIVAEKHAVSVEEVMVIDKRAAQLEPSDLVGGIFMVGGRTYNAPPSWLPVHPDSIAQLSPFLSKAGMEWTDSIPAKYGILFLDELNRAPAHVKQALFELKLDRSLHGVKIPDTWYIVTAENGDPDIYDVSEAEPADKDREIILSFNPSVDEFLSFMRLKVNSGEIHDAVLQFCQQNDDKIDPSKEEIEKASADGKTAQSRRSFFRLGQALQNLENNLGEESIVDFVQKSSNETALRGIVEGFLGTAMAGHFVQFVKESYNMLSPDTILNKWSKKVKERVTKMSDPDSDESNIPAIAGLNHAVVAKMTEDPKSKLSKKQSVNILEYLECQGKEQVSGFYADWGDKAHDQFVAWHNSPRRRAVIIRSLNSKALKKFQEEMKSRGIDPNSDEPM